MPAKEPAIKPGAVPAERHQLVEEGGTSGSADLESAGRSGDARGRRAERVWPHLRNQVRPRTGLPRSRLARWAGGVPFPAAHSHHEGAPRSLNQNLSPGGDEFPRRSFAQSCLPKTPQVPYLMQFRNSAPRQAA
jgi:hypothetical protein